MSLIDAERDDDAVLRAEDEAIAHQDIEEVRDPGLTALEDILRGEVHEETETLGGSRG